MRCVHYLHGFASGPTSAKGRYFRRRFSEAGVELHLPDLAEGNFPHATLTRQLDAARGAAVAAKPSLLIGSSLGGYLAALLAKGDPGLAPALVLLAPALDFGGRWARWLGETEIAAWKKFGVREVYHYGEKRGLPLAYEFYRDAAEHDSCPEFSQPCLLNHGRRDDVVDAAQSIDYAQGKSQIRLEIVDSGHALTDILDDIWASVYDFYRTHEPARQLDA